MPDRPLRSAWEDNAEAWIRWARTPDHDAFFWRFGLPHLLEMLPSPGRLCVDIGCGEGRLTRILRDRGYNAVGIDGSLTLARAAGAHGEAAPVLAADAAALPIHGGSADLAIAYMVLQDVDDLDAVVREAARVLGGGGRFCAAVTHPIQTWLEIDEPLVEGARDSSLPPGAWKITRPYFRPVRLEDVIERDGIRMTFNSEHRTLERYMRAFEDAGFLIETFHEPQPDPELIASRPRAARFAEVPWAFFVRAVRALWA